MTKDDDPEGNGNWWGGGEDGHGQGVGRLQLGCCYLKVPTLESIRFQHLFQMASMYNHTGTYSVVIVLSTCLTIACSICKVLDLVTRKAPGNGK